MLGDFGVDRKKRFDLITTPYAETIDKIRICFFYKCFN